MTSFTKKFQKLPPPLVTLLLVCVILTSAWQVPAARMGNSQKKVVFIRANYKPDHGSAMVEQFMATLRKRGYVEGRDIEYVDISICGKDPEGARKAMEAVDRFRDTADLFVTSGWISADVRSRLAGSDIPQIFAPVLMEEALTMLPELNLPTRTNLSGVYLNYPPERILRLARLILPDILNYAYVYDSRISTDNIMQSTFEKLAEQDRHGLNLFFLDLAAGVGPVLQQMKVLRIEAFGGLIGAYKKREELAHSGLPMITALLMDIDRKEVADRIRDSNILAGLFDPLDYCGEQAGEMAADILDGKSTIAAAEPRPACHVSFVNMESAARVQVHIPFTTLEAADIVIK